MSALQDLEASVQAAWERSGPAVVGIGRGWGVGSGTVFAPGRVMTSAHNLRHDEATVTFIDGRQEGGRVLGSDPDVDVAVIEVETGHVEPVHWPEGDLPLPAGRAVLALGNPGGRGLRITPGFVSSPARSFRGPRGRRVAGAIEHTAPLPRGSSGGPLIDNARRLLGINTIRVDGGLILAIPADAALRDRVDSLA